MKYLAILLAFLMLAGTGTAYANGGGEGDHTDCQGQGNPNSPCDPDDDDNGGNGGGGGSGGEGGSGGSVDIGDVTVGGGSVGDTTATGGNATGGNATIIIGGSGECYEGECEGGEGTLNSNADSNSESTAVAGASSVVGVDVDNDNSSASESSGNETDVVTDVDVNIDASSVYEAADIPVNSAPPSFAAICSSGAAGSGSKVSLSFAVTSDVCTALMMADAYQARGNLEQVDYWIERAAKHARWKGNVGLFRTVITIGIL
jgi:hypothetical protein